MSPDRAPLALYVSLLLLGGCAGGGGTKAMPAFAAPTPPTPPKTSSPCVPTADCVLKRDGDNGVSYLNQSITSGYALIKQDDHYVDLRNGIYLFGSGTRIEAGGLTVGEGVILRSDPQVLPGGWLSIIGTVEGNLTNNGSGKIIPYQGVDAPGTTYVDGGQTALWGIVRGNVLNNGIFSVSGDPWWAGATPPGRIEGNYRQSASGTLAVSLPSGEITASDPPSIPGRTGSYPLRITGRADIEGGTLWLYRACNCWDFGPEPLPKAPVAVHVLHADDGVSGRFDEWISPGLFIEGGIRYEARDVWFDLARASVAATIASQAGSGLVIASAGNIDSALAGSDGFAGMPPPTLDLAQRQFLASASSLLWMQDREQAVRALESLSGHAHVSVREQLHAQVTDSSSQLDARLSELAYSVRPLAWSQSLANTPGSRSFQGAAGGIDQWLTPRLLVGAAIGDGRSTLNFDSMGGQASGESPIASLYAHYRGDGWHATGQAGAGRASIWMQRPIQIGTSATHAAHSQRVFDHAFAHGEIGREVAFAGGRLLPFAALDYMDLRSAGFAEQGDTGFELIGAAQAQSQLSGSVGARYARQWAFGRNALRLDLGASYRHDLLADGDRLRAAFRGVPDVWFDVPGQQTGGVTELRLGLGGALGQHWNWSMDGIRRLGNDAYDDYQLGFERSF